MKAPLLLHQRLFAAAEHVPTLSETEIRALLVQAAMSLETAHHRQLCRDRKIADGMPNETDVIKRLDRPRPDPLLRIVGR